MINLTNINVNLPQTATNKVAQAQSLPQPAAPSAGIQTNLMALQPSPLSGLLLPSLQQLTNPALLARLIARIGNKPNKDDPQDPLAGLLRQWQQQPKANVAARISELLQFQQHSDRDPQQPQLFLQLPYQHQQQPSSLQIALKQYRSRADAEPDCWLLQLRLELTLGVMLANVRFHQQQYGVELVCSTAALTEVTNNNLTDLQQQLSEVAITHLHCRKGPVAADLRFPEASYG